MKTIGRLFELIPDAAPFVAGKIRPHLDSQALAFIARSPFLVMATCGETGLELSPKGDGPGFVAAVDRRTLLIPERKGNRLTLGLRNILRSDQVGLMFLRPATEEVLRITGRAELIDDADICRRLEARGEPAILAIRVRVARCFFHCVRSLKRARLWDPASWDEPGHISFGQIYAEAMSQPDLESTIDQMSEAYGADL